MKLLTLFILAQVAGIGGCATRIDPPDPGLLSEIRGSPASSDSALSELGQVNIIALSDELKAFVDSRIDRKWHSRRRLQELRNILFSPDLFAIEYESGRTKTAIETYGSRSGNCLSMTNLFIAMARYSGLEARYHLVKARPEWDQSGNTLIWTQHINSTGMLRNGDRYVLDFLPSRRTAQREMETVSDQTAFAIYYNNLAAEAIFDAQYPDALGYLRIALRLEPKMADVWNNMGATQRRLNRPDLAVASYQQAILLDPFSNTAMSNLSRLYYAQGEETLGEYYAGKVTRHRNRNPYYRYANARLALSEKKYEMARDELNAAVRLKEDEAIFFDALAEVYRQLGDKEKESVSLRLAKLVREKTNEHGSSLEIYRAGNVILDP